MSETPLRLASLREIAEELLRRQSGDTPADVKPSPDVSTGVRKGRQRQAEKGSR